MRNRTGRVVILILMVSLLAVPVPAWGQADLSETYTTAGGLFSFRYPAGWVVEEDLGTIVLASSAETLTVANEGGQLGPGQVAIAFLPPQAVQGQFGGAGLPLDEGPRAFVEALAALLSSSPGAIQEFSAGDRAVVGSTIAVEGQAQTLYAVDMGESGLMIAALLAAPGEEAAYNDLVTAIFATVEATPAPEPTETAALVWQQQRPISEDPFADGGFSEITALAVGPDDMIYLADSFVGIHVFAPDGTEQGFIAPEGFFGSIADLVVAPDGGLWIIDFSGAVTNLSAGGEVVSSFNLGEAVEVAFFSLRMELGPDGHLYILNPKDAGDDLAVGEMLVFDTAGSFLRSFEVGSANFFYEASFAFGPDGLLYVAENFGQPGIKVFDTEGTLIQEGLGASVLFGGVSALAVAPDGSIYAALPASPVYHLAPDGTLLGRYGESQFTVEDLGFDTETYPAFQPGLFFEITDLAVLSTAEVVVGDYNPNHVQIVRVAFGE